MKQPRQVQQLYVMSEEKRRRVSVKLKLYVYTRVHVRYKRARTLKRSHGCCRWCRCVYKARSSSKLAQFVGCFRSWAEPAFCLGGSVGANRRAQARARRAFKLIRRLIKVIDGSYTSVKLRRTLCPITIG